MTLRRSAIVMAVVLAAALPRLSTGQDGYRFELKLTTPDARHDPDGVWSDDDLAFIRQLGQSPSIYTARMTTPAGEWLLSQTNGDCNMQGMCTTLLLLRKAGTTPVEMANPQLPLGGSATLSLNYKKLFTRELDQNGNLFDGAYDVAPIQ
ncbi:hypothetical protein BJF92_09130 [Rhizobium rhizosphaerae]|uniref:Uncharacterized protein n=1 Tax=Xaviernesmea rhizosphaerae TaxID=1672749 RepID=A0A1Q9AKG4_9HYPH|nr:hypothetical protein [Xaviernesmea rhizosphaerae]OLP55786.1 hypothetical protein BJF92_09130 [Xaviernesmea rhizosphaerae]